MQILYNHQRKSRTQHQGWSLAEQQQHPTAKPPGLLSTDFLLFLGFFFLYRETLQPCCCEAEQFLCYFGWLVTNSMKTFRCKVSWLDAVWSGTPSMWRGQIWCFSRVRGQLFKCIHYINIFFQPCAVTFILIHCFTLHLSLQFTLLCSATLMPSDIISTVVFLLRLAQFHLLIHYFIDYNLIFIYIILALLYLFDSFGHTVFCFPELHTIQII